MRYPVHKPQNPGRSNWLRSITLISLPILLLLLRTSPAWSVGYFDLYGMGSRCTAMGGACTAIADDSSAVFYNAGALTVSEKMNVNFFVINNDINLDLDMNGDWSALEQLRGVTTDELERYYTKVDEIIHAGFSAVMPIIQDRSGESLFSFGMSFSMGMQYCIRFLFLDPVDPFFLEYSNYPNKLNMIFTGGLNLSGIANRYLDLELPGISFGAGINGFFDGAGGMYIQPPARFDLQMPIDMAPLVGFLITPFEGFYSDALESIRLGFSWSKSMSMEFAMEMGISGMSGITRGYDLFHIGQWGLSIGADPVEDVTVAYERTRYTWSDFEPPYYVAEGTLSALTTEFAFEKLSDTWVDRFGAEYRPLDFLKLRLGYFYRPSPVPEQIDVPTTVDCDTHALSMGIGIRISDMISADAHSQYKILAERTMRKTSGASITASGNVWHIGLTFSLFMNP